MNRRSFFRQGLRELLRPLAGAVEPLAEAAKQFGNLERQFGIKSEPPKKEEPRPQRAWLRPPGAIQEPEFRSVCCRSSQCVHVCPVHCIQLDYSGDMGDGYPYIDADNSACAVCEGLSCMNVCPSSALRPTEVAAISMGTAVWTEYSCLRTQGQECTMCIDKCPRGAAAIQLLGGRVDVISSGCVGCGMCQQVCPTGPKSITVTPRSQPFVNAGV